MHLVYWVLAIMTASGALVMVNASLNVSLICFTFAIFFTVLSIYSLFKEDKKQTIATLLTDILQQQNRLYHSNKGRITYEIDKETIRMHVQVKNESSPVLSFVYNKTTGAFDLTKQSKYVSDLKRDLFKQLIWEKDSKKVAVTSQPIQNAFEKRLHEIDLFRKELLQEAAFLEVETVHLLEQTIPRDVERIRIAYLTSKEARKEANFTTLLQPIRATLQEIQQALHQHNHNEFEKLEALVFNRYAEK